MDVRSLLMLRHAKSDWRLDSGVDDLGRPLAGRGRRAARAVGQALRAAEEVPDRALVSPARRAQETLVLAVRAGGWECDVEICEELYGSPDDVLDAIRRRGRDARRLMVVGHQPTWSATASELANGATLRLPTASVLRLDFDVDDWQALQGEGHVAWLVTPRLLEGLLERRRLSSSP